MASPTSSAFCTQLKFIHKVSSMEICLSCSNVRVMGPLRGRTKWEVLKSLEAQVSKKVKLAFLSP